MKMLISEVRLRSILFLALLGLIVEQGLMAADGPRHLVLNAVLIISDDHAWTDYGFAAHPQAKTPNIDLLASEGLTYERGSCTLQSLSGHDAHRVAPASTRYHRKRPGPRAKALRLDRAVFQKAAASQTALRSRLSDYAHGKFLDG